MKNIELHISALNASISSEGNFVVLLQEINGARKVPILIGQQEAKLIAIALEQLQPPRPLTHDLFLNTINILKATLERVKICSCIEGIYMSVIVIKDQDQRLIEIDSRTSDAIALAAREKCSIFIEEYLLAEVAMQDAADGTNLSDKRLQFERFTLQELYDMLAGMLEKEDYENAGIIRDIISKKEQ